MDTVEVLLSTYNGERFLREQLDSIINQKGIYVKISIRDDGSKDNTISIIKDYIEKYKDSINFIEDNFGNIGVIKSYEKLLINSKEKYLAFSDQDDIWLPDKLVKSLEVLKEIENRGSMPVLVYSDLKIVDQNLNTIANSFFKMMKINAERGMDFKSLVVQNAVVGCTTLFNKKLKEYSLPFPSQCIMHDWWLALCANYYGKAAYVPQQLILYRQHQNNVIGAKAPIEIFKNRWKRKTNTFDSIKQAVALYSMSPGNEYLCNFLKAIKDKTKLGLKIHFLIFKVMKSTFLRNLYFYIFEW